MCVRESYARKKQRGEAMKENEAGVKESVVVKEQEKHVLEARLRDHLKALDEERAQALLRYNTSIDVLDIYKAAFLNEYAAAGVDVSAYK